MYWLNKLFLLRTSLPTSGGMSLARLRGEIPLHMDQGRAEQSHERGPDHPLQMGCFKLGWGGSLVFFCWGGAPAQKEPRSSCKGPKPQSLKLGFHPHTTPTCPRGGSLNCRL